MFFVISYSTPQLSSVSPDNRHMGIPVLLALGVIAVVFAGCNSKKEKQRPSDEGDETNPFIKRRLDIDRFIKQDPPLNAKFAACAAMDGAEAQWKCKADAYDAAKDKVAVFRVGPVFQGQHFYVVDTLRDMRASQGGPGQAVQVFPDTNPLLMATQDGAIYRGQMLNAGGQLAMVGSGRAGFFNEISALWTLLNLRGDLQYPLINRDLVILEGGTQVIADAPLYVEPGAMMELAGFADQKDVDILNRASLGGFSHNLQTMDTVLSPAQMKEIGKPVHQGGLSGQLVLREKGEFFKGISLREEVGPFGGFGDGGLSLGFGQDMGAAAVFFSRNLPGRNAVIREPLGTEKETEKFANYRIYRVEGEAAALESMEKVPLPGKGQLTAMTESGGQVSPGKAWLDTTKDLDPKFKKDLSVLLLAHALKKLDRGDQSYLMALEPDVVALANRKQQDLLRGMVRDRTIQSAEARDRLTQVLLSLQK